MRWLALLVVLTGCPGLKKHDIRNAPGVVDVDTAPPSQTASPELYEVPADPGEHHLGIAPGFFVGPGEGRLDLVDETTDATVELGAQLHLSYGDTDKSGGAGVFGYPWDAWGVSIGWGVQTSTNLPTVVAPVYLEATRHFYLASASAGLALYPTAGKVAGGRAEGVDLGGQVTLGFWPYMLRMRYMQDTGFELFGVVQLELPTSITWSK